MPKLKMPLRAPWLDEADIGAMEAIVRQKPIAQGGIIARFEADFAQYLGAAGAVATNSGTSTLILALKTLVSIPLYPALTDGEVEYVFDIRRIIFGGSEQI